MAEKPEPRNGEHAAYSRSHTDPLVDSTLALHECLNALSSVCTNAHLFCDLDKRRTDAWLTHVALLNLRGREATARATHLARDGAPFEQQFVAAAEGLDGVCNFSLPNEPAQYIASLRDNVLNPGRTWCTKGKAAIREGGAREWDAATTPNASGLVRSLELHTKLQEADRVLFFLSVCLSDPQIVIGDNAARMADLGGWFAHARAELAAVLETRGLNTNEESDHDAHSTLPELGPHDMQAWQWSLVSGMTQAKVAQKLREEYPTETHWTQPRVSEAIRRAQAHAKASGLADMVQVATARAPARTLDPAVADRGRRSDGRAHHLREKARQIEDGD